MSDLLHNFSIFKMRKLSYSVKTAGRLWCHFIW